MNQQVLVKMKTRSGIAFLHERNLIINMDHVKIPVGYGNRSHIGKSSDRYFKLHKKSIFSPNLRDEDYCLCLAVSIIVAIAHSIGNLSKYYYLTYAGHYNELILKLFSIYYLMKPITVLFQVPQLHFPQHIFVAIVVLVIQLNLAIHDAGQNVTNVFNHRRVPMMQ